MVFNLKDYQVFVQDLATCFPGWLRARTATRVVILTDEHTRRHCLPVFLATTGLPPETPCITIPAGESFKHLATCEFIWKEMFALQLDRKALMINLGGGVIGDMGGFCAATYKRGIDFVQAPTTLLAMTDASIGGKLAIDFQGIKNAVGVFRNPASVFVDPVFLETLPERELYSGFAEIIKHALIGNPDLWLNIQRTDNLGLFDWQTTLEASIGVKVAVVEEDPQEKGIRMLLNYGHTVGHAIESYFLNTPEPLTHGEAVYAGMVMETLIAGRKPNLWAGWLPLPVIPDSVVPELWAYMEQDKKNTSGKVRMALPDEEPFKMKVLELDQEAFSRALLQYKAYLSR